MRRSRAVRLAVLALVVFLVYAQWRQIPAHPNQQQQHHHHHPHGLSMTKLQEDLAVCAKLRATPQDPIGLGRDRNARYLDGHKPTLIKNATVWVGEPVAGTSPDDARAGKGWEWVTADVFVEYGLIKEVVRNGRLAEARLPHDTIVWDAHGRPLTSGVIDMHSHAGVDSLPELRGNADTNEMSSDITPYARAIDSIQPQDPQIQVIKSGGVTTSLVLPGSGNNIGGEAYVIKHAVGPADGRAEISAEDMLADPARTWRYMKMACGENAKRIYGKVGEHGPVSRMGESWEFRHAFERAARFNQAQDDWCAAAAAESASGLEGLSSYLPQELEWEALGAALRGQVHINTHCYTIPDLEAMVDHTNEFRFPVRAFHHAHQTFLVPEILKRTWGGRPPASALFATNMYYKAEAYVGSEYAGKVLYEHGLTPVYVSDNPVLNAQHVLFEAAKAYHFGLPYHAALASVTSAPAELLGLGNRLGKVLPGYDADLVVWDSDPLSVGATPVQVWIDGTAQYEDPFQLAKPLTGPLVPDVRLNRTNEETAQVDNVIFTGVAKILLPLADDVAAPNQQEEETAAPFNVVVTNGHVTCVGTCAAALGSAARQGTKTIHLRHGYLTPAFTAFGATLGLTEIDAEAATDDGDNTEDAAVFSRAVDGLALGTKKLGVAHAFGVTRAVTAPKYAGGGDSARRGVSVGFATGAQNKLAGGNKDKEEGSGEGSSAVWADEVSVHYTLSLKAKRDKTPSISSAVGALRRKLLAAVAATAAMTKEQGKKEEGVVDAYSEEAYLQKVVTGTLPLVITVHSADTIASILEVKAAVEAEMAATTTTTTTPPNQNQNQNQTRRRRLRLILHGAAEAHLLAPHLAAADVGVVLAPVQSYGETWDQRRALTGAPRTNGTSVDRLVAAGVTTALGLEEDWRVRDLALLAGVAYRNSGGLLSEAEALGLISGNVDRMLGLDDEKNEKKNKGHFLVFEGSPLEIGSRIRAVGGGLGRVSVFE